MTDTARREKELGRKLNPQEKVEEYTRAVQDAERFFQAQQNRINLKDDNFNNDFTTFPNTNIGGEGNTGLGFRNGGYTGSEGGTVHPREFVLKEEAVDRIGLAKLYAMNNGKMGRNTKVTVIQAPDKFINNPIDPNNTTEISATSVRSVPPGDRKNRYNGEFIDEINLKSLLA